MKYKVLKEFLTVKNPRWLAPGEVIDGQPTGARIKALLDKGYIEEILEQPKTVWDLREGDKYWGISLSELTGFHIGEHEFGLRAAHYREVGDVFLTREAAEKELARRKAKVILERDTKGFKPTYKQQGVCIFWNHDKRSLPLSDCLFFDGTLRFANHEDAEASIKAHEKEWKTYLGVEE